MRLHHALDGVLTSPVMLRTARALVQSGSQERTGRELARGAGASAPQTIRALNEFEKVGLVRKRVIGRSHVWRLNEEHVLTEALRRLFKFESGLPARFRFDLKESMNRLPVQEAILFGSVARGTESDASDADLYMVLSRKASEDDVQAALTPITVRFIQRYGTVISPLIHTATESSEPRNPALMRAIRKEGIPIVGGADE